MPIPCRYQAGALHEHADTIVGVEASFGVKPTVLRFSDYGFTSYAQVIMANDQLLATHPDAVRAFLAATFAGWNQALADIPATAKLVAGHYAADGSKYTDVDYQLELIGDYVKLNLGSDGIGVIDPATWTAASELMANYGIIDALPAPEASLATGFWPTA